LKRIFLMLGVLTLLSACSTHPETSALDCPSDLPQAITVSLLNANGGLKHPQGGSLDGQHKFMLSHIEPAGAVALFYGQTKSDLQRLDLSPGQSVTINSGYMELAVFDAQTQPERHRAILCTDSQNTWHVQ